MIATEPIFCILAVGERGRIIIVLYKCELHRLEKNLTSTNTEEKDKMR